MTPAEAAATALAPLVKRLLDCAFALSHPRFWLTNDHACPFHDALVNDLIDMGAPVVRVDDHHTSVGGVVLWTQNYPYAYGCIATPGVITAEDRLPYRRTKRRLYRYIARRLNNEALTKARGEA